MSQRNLVEIEERSPNMPYNESQNGNGMLFEFDELRDDELYVDDVVSDVTAETPHVSRPANINVQPQFQVVTHERKVPHPSRVALWQNDELKFYIDDPLSVPDPAPVHQNDAYGNFIMTYTESNISVF